MGQLVISSGSKVYVDTAVLIYTLEVNTDYFSLLQPLWAKFQAREIELVSSELILMEVLVLPLRNNNQSLISDYEQTIALPKAIADLSSTESNLITVTQL